jgi:hypothetical protein
MLTAVDVSPLMTLRPRKPLRPRKHTNHGPVVPRSPAGGPGKSIGAGLNSIAALGRLETPFDAGSEKAYKLGILGCPRVALARGSREPGQALTGAALNGVLLCEGLSWTAAGKWR